MPHYLYPFKFIFRGQQQNKTKILQWKSTIQLSTVHALHLHKESSTQKSSSVCCTTLLYFDAHWSKLDTWQLFFDAWPSMSGVRLWSEEILRIEWRCSSVRLLLCDVCSPTSKRCCSYWYLLPEHRESIWGAWVWTCIGDQMWKLCSAQVTTWF